jgi:hypothetical protein
VTNVDTILNVEMAFIVIQLLLGENAHAFLSQMKDVVVVLLTNNVHQAWSARQSLR